MCDEPNTQQTQAESQEKQRAGAPATSTPPPPHHGEDNTDPRRAGGVKGWEKWASRRKRAAWRHTGKGRVQSGPQTLLNLWTFHCAPSSLQGAPKGCWSNQNFSSCAVLERRKTRFQDGEISHAWDHPRSPQPTSGRICWEMSTGARWREVVRGRNQGSAPPTQPQVSWSCWVIDWYALAHAPVASEGLLPRRLLREGKQALAFGFG